MKKSHLSISSQQLLATTLIIGPCLLWLLYITAKHLPDSYISQPNIDVLLRAWLLVCLSFSFPVALRQRSWNLKAPLLCVCLGLFLAGTVILGLNGTAYSLNGDHGDQGLLIAQVTKLAENFSLPDFVYKDLPAFYPPLYALILGRASVFLPVAPFEMLKYGLVLIAYVLPLLSYLGWLSLFKSRTALWLSFAMLLYQDWYKPAEWISLFLFVPWWLFYVQGVAPVKKGRKFLWLLAGGGLGALLFLTYYYWFFVGVISILSLKIFEYLAFNSDNYPLPRLGDQLVLLAIVALFSSIYWLPLLVSMGQEGGFESLQNRFYSSEFSQLQMPLQEISLLSLLMAGGLGFLLYNARRLRVAYLLLNLIIAAYIWQFLGIFAHLIDFPLLVFKTREMVNYILIVAALWMLSKCAYRDWPQNFTRSGIQVLKFGVVLFGLIFFGQETLDGLSHHPLRPTAYEVDYPYSLIASYAKLTKGELGNQVVLSSGNSDLVIYSPSFDFLAWSAHFSHPSALFHRRTEFLRKLSELDNPELFALALMNNRYSHIDQVLLIPVENGYSLTYFDDAFPQGSRRVSLVFNRQLFDNEFFSRTKGDNWVFYTPEYARNPLNLWLETYNSEAENLYENIGVPADTFYNFLEDFAPHLQFSGQQELLSQLVQILRSRP